jgi:hypothetical protein
MTWPGMTSAIIPGMTDPEQPDHRPSRLRTGSHHDRSREVQIAEERKLFREQPDAREQLAFWCGVLAEIEGND